MTKKVILLLYTERSSYLDNCLKELAQEQIEVHLVSYPVNKEAPFVFSGSTFYNYERDQFKNKIELLEFSQKLNPDLVLVSGWIDKDYLYVALKLKTSCTTVMAMDTPWTGSIRQRVLSTLAFNYFSKRFNYVWVPGIRQQLFAEKIGFSKHNIMTGFYSGDVDYFKNYYDNSILQKRKSYPKVFLFLGRYINNKCIHELCASFKAISEANNHQWELWCVGTGEEWENRIIHPKIKHLGFLQPSELKEVVANSGVYVLPSKFEPWGVSLHEFVAAGFPVIASKYVGSAELFLENNLNGLLINSCSKLAISQSILQMMKMSDQELLAMSQESLNLSNKITPKKWVDKLKSLL